MDSENLFSLEFPIVNVPWLVDVFAKQNDDEVRMHSKVYCVIKNLHIHLSTLWPVCVFFFNQIQSNKVPCIDYPFRKNSVDLGKYST